MSDPRDPRDPRYPPRRPGLYEQHPLGGAVRPIAPLIPMPVQLPGMQPPSPFTSEGTPSGYAMQIPEGQPFPRPEMFTQSWFQKLAGAVAHGVESAISKTMERAVKSGLNEAIPNILTRFLPTHNPKLEMGFFFEFPNSPLITYFHKVGVIAFGNAGANAIQNITLTNDGTAQLSVPRGQVLFLTDIRFSIVVSGLGAGPVILSAFGQQSDYSLLGSVTFRVAVGGRGFMRASVEVPAALSATTFQDGVGVIQRGFGTQSGVKYVIYCEEGAQIDSQVISRTAIGGIPGGATPYALCELFGFTADKVWSKRYNSWI